MNRCAIGDCRDVLKTLPDGSVHCVVTSPPYWGLRDYGTAQWEGGDAGCDHKPPPSTKGDYPDSGRKQQTNAGSFGYREWRECGKCGAKRIDRQIGQEPTPDAYVQTMVEVFREVRRVLHDSGTVWLNVGDSYASANACDRRSVVGQGSPDATCERPNRLVGGLKEKDLCLIPWRLALALQADGWWVRSVICWAKKSCMPESVTDRPTNSWEPIFLLAKNSRYFYDAEAVKEPALQDEFRPSFRGGAYINNATFNNSEGGKSTDTGNVRIANATRNQRNVWHLGPEPYAEAHFATFPSEIPKRAIMAGTSEKGCCPECREPWVRVVEKDKGEPDSFRGSSFNKGKTCAAQSALAKVGDVERTIATRTIGWEPGCECGLEPIPCTVLDPFMGSGATAQAAQDLGRRWLGCELSEQYHKLIGKRTAQQGMVLF